MAKREAYEIYFAAKSEKIDFTPEEMKFRLVIRLPLKCG